MSYDARGSTTNNSHYSMTYNLANQMTQANGTSYLYDGHNRRVRINNNEFNVYSNQGQLLLRKKDNVETHYVYLGNRLLGKRKGSSVDFVHTDMLGSAVVETAQNRSLSQPRDYYRAYGETIGTARDDVGYTGHLFDSETGLNYMQARYYDPVIGRFYSNDPVGLRDVHSFNRYAYANNNPYKYVDSDGNESRMAVAAAADTRAFTSGKISRGEYTSRMKARAAAARTALRNTPLGRVASAALAVASIALNESSENESSDTDSEVSGLTEGLEPETNTKGKPRKGQYVNPDGNAAADLESLSGEMGESGQKTLPDGSTAGIHDSSGTSGGKKGENSGSKTLEIRRPKGKQNVKIRYPNDK